MIPGRFIQLRRLERRDIETVRQWRSSPEVGQHFSGKEQLSELQQEAWFERISSSDATQFFILEDRGGMPHGVVNLAHIDPVHRRSTWGIYVVGDSLSPLARVESAMRILDYGFDVLNLHRIYSDCLSTNPRILEFVRGLGFQEEGVLRSHVFHEGRYIDAIMTGVLRDEYRAATARFRPLLAEHEQRASNPSE